MKIRITIVTRNVLIAVGTAKVDMLSSDCIHFAWIRRTHSDPCINLEHPIDTR